MIQTFWKNRTETVCAFEQNGSRIKRFRKPERSDDDETLLGEVALVRSDNVLASDPILLITAVLPIM
jgi:hypothetical protein